MAEEQHHLKSLFCPFRLVSTLSTFGKKQQNEIYKNSHKCQFRLNTKTYMMEMHIRQNTYFRKASRTITNEQATKDMLAPLIVGLKAAKIICKNYKQLYPDIRQGLYNLIICYSGNDVVCSIISNTIENI